MPVQADGHLSAYETQDDEAATCRVLRVDYTRKAADDSIVAMDTPRAVKARHPSFSPNLWRHVPVNG